MFHSKSFRKRDRRAAVWNRGSTPQGVECLEVRTLPAGNVAVSVVDGVLMIRGDDQANYVAIRQLPQTFTGAWPGASYEIRTDVTVSQNLFKDAPSPTAINGDRSQTTIQVSEVNRGVNINLRGGDDGLFVGSGVAAKPTVNLPGTVVIDAGAGDDDLRLYVTNRTDTTISGGYGNDRIRVAGGPFFQLAVQTSYAGVNNQNGTGGSIALVSLTVNGPLELKGSPGDESIQVFAGSVFRARVTIDLGGALGSNRFLTRLETASGSRGTRPAQYEGPIFVNGGDQRDSIELNNGDVLGVVTAFLRGGNDTIRLGATDGVAVELNVDLGAGNDDDAFLFGRYTGMISGGAGSNDQLTRQADEIFGDVIVTDFEAIRMF